MSLPWSNGKEFYDLHSKAMFTGQKFYQVGLVGTAEENVAHICRVADIRRGDYVIDLGCGSGFMVNHIASETFAVGISDSESCIVAAQMNYPACHFSVQDMASLDAANVDVFLALESIGYADLKKTLKAVSAALRPGGRFFIKDMVPFANLTPAHLENLAYIRWFWKYACTPQDETIRMARRYGLILKQFTAYDSANVANFVGTMPLLQVEQKIPHPELHCIRPAEFLFEKDAP